MRALLQCTLKEFKEVYWLGTSVVHQSHQGKHLYHLSHNQHRTCCQWFCTAGRTQSSSCSLQWTEVAAGLLAGCQLSTAKPNHIKHPRKAQAIKSMLIKRTEDTPNFKQLPPASDCAHPARLHLQVGRWEANGAYKVSQQDGGLHLEHWYVVDEPSVFVLWV